LEENGNGLPEFDLGLGTAFLVKENLSLKGIEAKKNAIEQGYMVEENGGKPSQINIDDLQKQPKIAENDEKTATNGGNAPFPIMSFKNVYDAIKLNRKIKYSQLEDNLGLGETTIRRAIAWLKENGYINPVKSKVKGEWQLI